MLDWPALDITSVIYKTNHAIGWIVICPVDSAIHVSNNLLLVTSDSKLDGTPESLILCVDSVLCLCLIA